jgi:hypothetical protein
VKIKEGMPFRSASLSFGLGSNMLRGALKLKPPGPGTTGLVLGIASSELVERTYGLLGLGRPLLAVLAATAGLLA